MTFDSNFAEDTCLHMSYTYKQLAIYRDYRDRTVEATKCRILAENNGKPNLNLTDIYELLFSSN